MKKVIKRITLYLFIFVFVFGFFLMLNSGFKFDSPDSVFQTLFFTLITLLLIFQLWLKKVFVILSVVLFVIMVVFFTLDFIDIANFFGTLGFGTLIILSLFYIPKLFKYGHV